MLNQGSDNVSNSNSNMMGIRRTRLGLTLIILFGNADMAGEDVLMPHKPSINATTEKTGLEPVWFFLARVER